MKKIVSILFLLAMLSCVDALAEDNLTATLQNGTLSVSLTNSETYTTFQVDILFPEGVTIADNAATASSTRLPGYTIYGYNLTSSKYRVVVYGDASSKVEGSSGVLFTLPLTIAANTKGVIELKNNLFTTTDDVENTLPAVYVSLYPQGDVSGDGNVNIKDVVDLIGILLNTNTDTYHTADVDKSGVVDLADVTALRNIIIKE